MIIRRIALIMFLCAAPLLAGCAQDESPADSDVTITTPSSLVAGHTIEWSWDEGEFAGASYRGVFRKDGTVTWLGLTGGDKDQGATEKQYGARHLTGDVVVVSWLEEIGYTVTLVLDFDSMSVRGIASNEAEWYEAGGTFEVVE